MTLDAAHPSVEHALFQPGRRAAATAGRQHRRAHRRGARRLHPGAEAGRHRGRGAGRSRSSRSRRRLRRRGCPRRSRCPPQARTAATASRYFTVSAQSGGSRYRVRASIEPQAEQLPPDHRDLAERGRQHAPPAAPDRAARDRWPCSSAIALLGLWVVRLGLRPLAEIEETAGAIAAGDLSRRVERADERTEVGRLGLALNAMLSQIESAFRAREASERKLRRFVADASHELRTPLTAVRAYAELFTRGADRRPDDLARAMTGISRESRADEPPRRRPAPARAARRGPSAGAEGRRARARGRRRRRDGAHRRARPSDRVPRRARRRASATATGCGRSSTTCSATSAPTPRPERPSR